MAKKEKETKKKEVVNETKEVKKVEKKKEVKNKEKVKTKKDTKKKKTKKVPQENYFEGVKSEMSKVKWPSKKEVLKYTIATISFVVLLVAFFLLMSLIMSGIKGAFN